MVWDIQICSGLLLSFLHWKGRCTVCDTTWKQNIDWTPKTRITWFQSITYIDLHYSIALFHCRLCPKHTRPLQQYFLWCRKQSCSRLPVRKDPPSCLTLCVRWGRAWSSCCSPCEQIIVIWHHNFNPKSPTMAQARCIKCSSQPSMVHWLSSFIFPCSFVCHLSFVIWWHLTKFPLFQYIQA